MAMERWQLCRNQENDNRGCVATKTISQPHAADGRGATYARPGISARSICVGPGPSRVAQPELIPRRPGTQKPLTCATLPFSPVGRLKERMSFPKSEVLQGTLDLLVLKTLESMGSR